MSCMIANQIAALKNRSEKPELDMQEKIVATN